MVGQLVRYVCYHELNVTHLTHFEPCWLTNVFLHQVTSMENMFTAATSFNQPLNNWDVSSVTNMSGMFPGAAFNQPLDNWDVSSVTRMSSMFTGDSVFNQDLCHFGNYFDSETDYGNKDSGVDYRWMFDQSGCPNKGDPTSAEGPWCKASCP